MKHFSLFSFLFSLLLVACNKEDSDRLPDCKQPVTLTATMEGPSSAQAAQSATRATADNTWTGGEEVAVQIGSEVKKYAAATDGTLSATAPFYWTSSTEKKTVSAWTPYSDTKPTSLSVQADQSSAGYQQSDMIYATQKISYASPELEFCHLPVKLVVNLKNGDGVTETEVQNATVSIVNQNLTSGAINDADWIVAQVAQGSNTIIPNTLTTTTTDYQKTVQALLIPQTSTTSKRLIKVAVGGLEFLYSTTLDFAAGTQHTYNITVLKSGLSVTASGAEAWTGSETAVTSKEPATGFADKDLKIGDYYYSDGTWSDGGYRKYTDNSTSYLPVMPVLTDASGNPRTVVGIVFYKSADGKGGKVVGLPESTGRWGVSSVNETATDINSVTDGATATKNLITARKDETNFTTNYFIFNWVYNTINGGDIDGRWYIPAKDELSALYAAWNGGSSSSTADNAARTAFNEKFIAASGVVLSSTTSYWSATQFSSNNSWNVYFGFGYADDRNKRYSDYRVRCVSEF